MCRFLLSLVFLSIVGCVFTQRHHIHRRGVQIWGSFGKGQKPLTGNGFLINRFGEKGSNATHSHQITGNRHLQIRGSYGGSSSKSNATSGNVVFGNRFGDTVGAASGDGVSAGFASGGVRPTKGNTGIEFLDGFNANQLETTGGSETGSQSSTGTANGSGSNNAELGIKFIDDSTGSIGENEPKINVGSRSAGSTRVGATDLSGIRPSRAYLPPSANV